MYEQFYNLKANPFRLSPDPRLLFHASGHRKALACLHYGLQQGEGFIVVTGHVGAGKTLLARAMLSQVDKARVLAVELVTTQPDSDDVLRLVAAALGLTHRGLARSALLKHIETFLVARAREGRRVMLLVDEAQNLTADALEELRMLSNFQVGEKTQLQSLLFGQEAFRMTLSAPGMEQLRQRVIATAHLGPLSREETRDYILHRLKLCGWEDDPRFTDGACALIFEDTGGNPRRINLLCERVLLFGSIEELHEIDHLAVRTVMDEMRQEHCIPDAAAAPSTTMGAGSGKQFGILKRA